MKGVGASRFEEAAADLAFTLHMPRAGVILTILCLPVFAGQSAHAAPGVQDLKKDLKRAEAVLSKLRRLEEANGQEAFVKAARKSYPELYSKVSALR